MKNIYYKSGSLAAQIRGLFLVNRVVLGSVLAMKLQDLPGLHFDVISYSMLVSG